MVRAASPSSSEALTDNRNRTGGAVRAVFTKYGGNLGATGSVAHMFAHVGEITYPANAGSADAMVEAAIEAGADDVTSDASGHVVVCAVRQPRHGRRRARGEARRSAQRQGGVEAEPDDAGRRGEGRSRS